MDTKSLDILYNKLLCNTVESNIIHQKALSILTCLKKQYYDNYFNGPKGAIKYLYIILNLINKECQTLISDNNFKDVKTLEAMMLLLSVNISLFDRDIHNCLNKLLQTIFNLKQFYLNNDNIAKYTLIILEKMLVTSYIEQLQKKDFSISLLFKDITLHCIYSKKENSFTFIKKTFPKLFKALIYSNIEESNNTNLKNQKFSEVTKYSFIKLLKDEVCKIFNDNISYVNNKYFLEFLMILSQLFPFEYTSDFLTEINNYLKNNSEILPDILEHLFNIIEITIKTKTLDYMLTEILLNTLLDDNIQYQVYNNYLYKDYKLKNSYYKAICELIIKINTKDILKSYEYFLPILVISIETLKEDINENEGIEEINKFNSNNRNKSNDISKENIYANLKNITSILFSQNSFDYLINRISNNNENDFIDKIVDINIESTTNVTKEEQLIKIISNIFKQLLVVCLNHDYTKLFKEDTNNIFYYCFNLLYFILEKVSKFNNTFRNCIEETLRTITDTYDNIIFEYNNNKNSLVSHNNNSFIKEFKVFFAKCFNIFPAAFLNDYLRLECLLFDLLDPNYTDLSKVWIIPYIFKYYNKESCFQTILDYTNFFYETLRELLTKTSILYKDYDNYISDNIEKMSKNKNINLPPNYFKRKDIELNIETENAMVIDSNELDERFEDNSNINVKILKIRRYEIIINQIYLLLPYFSNISYNKQDNLMEIDEFCNLLKLSDLCTTTLKPKEYLQNLTNGIQILNCLEINSLVSNIESLDLVKLLSIQKIIKNIEKNKELQIIIRESMIVTEIFPILINNLNNNFVLHKAIKNESLFVATLNCISKISSILDNKVIIFHVSELINSINSSIEKSNIFQDINIKHAEENDIVLENDSNIANLNKNLDKNKDYNKKYFVALSIKIQIIIYLLKERSISDKLQQVLYEFFNNFFKNISTKSYVYNNIAVSNIQIIAKSFVDLFILILNNTTILEKSLEMFYNLWETQSQVVNTNLLPKQSIKILTLVFELIEKEYDKIIIKEDKANCNNYILSITNKYFLSVPITMQIVLLLKNNNKKVRNKSFELISIISSFMTKINNFDNWIKLLIALLASEDNELKSCVIKALARAFWDDKENSSNHIVLCQTAETLIILLDKYDKELIESIFLFIRVLVHIFSITGDNNYSIVVANNKVYNIKNFASIFLAKIFKLEAMKNFKVKIRNFIKCLILKIGYNSTKDIVNSENEDLIKYINKYMIKKENKKNMTEEESYYLNNSKSDQNINDSFIDNDFINNDEEEEFINNEFIKPKRKTRDNDNELFKNIENWNFNDDEEENLRKAELINSQKNNKENKDLKEMDDFDKLFFKSNDKLNNFFFNEGFNSKNEDIINNDNNKNFIKKDKDIFYDINKKKLIVNNAEYELKSKKSNNFDNENLNINETKINNKSNILNTKRKKINFDEDLNINQYDKRGDYNLKNKKVSDKFNADIEYLKNKNIANKDLNDFIRVNKSLSNTENRKNMINKFNRNKNKNSHFIKFSGDEYKSSGKGDKLVKGKYEPFAYLQLNPKAAIKNDDRSNITMFNKIMNNK